MTFYVVMSSLALFFLFATVSYLLYQHFHAARRINAPRPAQHADDRSIQSKTVTFILLGLALIFIIIAFLAPVILTGPAINSDFNFRDTGEIGDTIGGIMNPFIAISSVIVTGLAFYIQYIANIQQRDLFYKEQEASNNQLQAQIDSQNSQYRLQQFDSQFYELLRLHRENINEMAITGYNFEETPKGLKKYSVSTEGRKSFVVMKTELHCILEIYKTIQPLDQHGFRKCYDIFFFGLDQFTRNYPGDKELIKLLSDARKKHEEPNLRVITTNKRRKQFAQDLHLYFNYKPFSGHSSRLSHYFRHLYLAANTIADTDIIRDYEEKMKYFRILRAQLSVHEQIHLFYNWLSGFGSNWEDEHNSLFSEYRMIHNLWLNDLFVDPIVSNNVNYLRNKRSNNKMGNVFEMDS